MIENVLVVSPTLRLPLFVSAAALDLYGSHVHDILCCVASFDVLLLQAGREGLCYLVRLGLVGDFESVQVAREAKLELGQLSALLHLHVCTPHHTTPRHTPADTVTAQHSTRRHTVSDRSYRAQQRRQWIERDRGVEGEETGWREGSRTDTRSTERHVEGLGCVGRGGPTWR